jgi:hypothetical protein
MVWHAAVSDAYNILPTLLASSVKLDFFLYVGSAPAIRIWTAESSFQYPGDDVDPGGSYAGLGWLQAIPDLTQLINGTAERIDLAISGVDAQAVAYADEESAILRNAPVAIGVGVWSPEDELIGGSLFWLWFGTCDAPRVSSQPGNDGSPVRQLTLSCGSLFTSRRRPRFGYWTDVDHQTQFPGDTFFSQVALYNSATTVVWPN